MACGPEETGDLITDEDIDAGYPQDPFIKQSIRIVCRPGVRLRITQNLDKVRGVVNGAFCTILHVIEPGVMLVQLERGGVALLHPVASSDDSGRTSRVYSAAMLIFVIFYSH